MKPAEEAPSEKPSVSREGAFTSPTHEPIPVRTPRRQPVSSRGPLSWLRPPLASLRELYGWRILLAIVVCQWLLKGFVYHGAFSPGKKYYWRLKELPSPDISINHTLTLCGGALRPVIALASDLYPVGGYRKRWWIAICGSASTCACLVLVLVPVHSMPEWAAILCMFCVLTHVLFTDVLTEGVYAMHSRKCPSAAADLFAFSYFGNFLMQALASLCSGLILQSTGQTLTTEFLLPGAQLCFLSCVPCLALSVVVGMCNLIEEERVTVEESRRVRGVVSGQPEIVVIAAAMASSVLCIAFLSKAMTYFGAAILTLSLTAFCGALCRLFLRPLLGRQIVFKAIYLSFGIVTVDSAAYYFYTDSVEQYSGGPHFSPFFYVTVLHTVGSMVGALGASLYCVSLKKLTFRGVYLLLTPVGAAIGLINVAMFLRWNLRWGISDHVFMLGDEAIVNVIRALAMIPGTLLIAQCAPRHLESSVIGVLHGMVSLTMRFKGPAEAAICHHLGVLPRGRPDESAMFDNLWVGALIAAGLHLVPIFFVYLVPNEPQTKSLLGLEERLSGFSVTTGSPWQRLQERTGK